MNQCFFPLANMKKGEIKMALFHRGDFSKIVRLHCRTLRRLAENVTRHGRIFAGCNPRNRR